MAAVTVLGGVLLGVVDLLFQKSLPYPWANLANSRGDADYRRNNAWIAATEAALGVVLIVVVGRTARQRLLGLAAAVPLAVIGAAAFLVSSRCDFVHLIGGSLAGRRSLPSRNAAGCALMFIEARTADSFAPSPFIGAELSNRPPASNSQYPYPIATTVSRRPIHIAARREDQPPGRRTRVSRVGADCRTTVGPVALCVTDPSRGVPWHGQPLVTPV